MGGRGGASGFQSKQSRNFPNLTGSEKQIKWAEDIRNGLIDSIDAAIKSNRDYLKRFPNDFESRVKLDLFSDAKTGFLNQLNNIESAKEIIDKRNIYNPQRVVDLINGRGKDMSRQKSNGWIYDKKNRKMVKP